jgi:hypothetical protein
VLQPGCFNRLLREFVLLLRNRCRIDMAAKLLCCMNRENTPAGADFDDRVVCR